MYKIDRRGGGSKNRSLGQTRDINTTGLFCPLNIDNYNDSFPKWLESVYF